MKKYFIFAAIATAGLFASCSSSDDITSSDVQNPIEDADAREAIRLNIGRPGVMVTRGTGTVGGVGTGTTIANVWAGQTINVFMFKKSDETAAAVLYENVEEYNADHDPDINADAFAALTTEEKTKTPATTAGATTLNLAVAHNPGATTTTYLYNNQKMITPGSAENLIPGENTDDDGSGEAMIEDGTINYYPPQGNFDFFGYHADDAVASTATITEGTDLWTVPFTINGTQDLMSTKAELTGAADHAGDQAYIMAHAGTAGANATDPYSRSKDYYSAYAARKGVHPTLTFKHLLTRLQFSIIAGNKSAAGYVGETQDVTYTRAECDEWNEAGTNVAGALKYANTYYSFKAYSSTDATSDMADGIVLYMGTQDDSGNPATTYTVVKVFKNSESSWEGKYYAVAATDLDNVTTRLQLYEVTANATDYTIGSSIPVYVGDLSEVTLQDKKDYNYTLTNARQTTDVKTAGQAAHLDPLQAVKVKKIEVLSAKTKGKLSVAWTADNITDPNKITWDEDQGLDATRWLKLMDRPEYKKKDGADPAAVADFTDLQAMSDAIDAQIATLGTSDADVALKTALQAKQAALADSATYREDTKITAETYALLTTAAQTAKYEAIANSKNEILITLTPTSPQGTLSGTTFTSAPTPIGESIILSPGAYDANGVAQTGNAATEKIRMKVTLAQNVPTNWNHPQILEEKTQEYELDIPATLLPGSTTDKGFKQNTSYNVKLTVYGLERIEVIAVVEPWGDGGDIEVGADE